MAGKCDKEPAPKIGFVGLKGQSRAARHKNMALIEDIERINSAIKERAFAANCCKANALWTESSLNPEHRQPITPWASSIAVLQRGLCQKGR
jgi:hypothetical protein